jgi:enamine deaminase RidA (YjgF/YER057c/UK114 family)
MAIAARRDFFGKLALLGGIAALGAAGEAKAQTFRKRFVKRERPEQSGYSLAVVTEGAGRTIWLAGHTAATDPSGKSLAGDFDAQVRELFASLARTLEESGGKLSDMVTMTVFLTDPRNHPRMTAIRREIFGKDFPASASIAISHLASPNALLEIQGVAVVPA